ncbi:MAG TPA: succinate--CoA ligase subunit alpha [Actinomycetota bacterium]|jgi:succinyl-CoA synthetase alpha subunit|nr:succinate--CoA ligase subunit alpha [Actinomycetota bacterium]
MSILLDENTKVLIQGITGREGTLHGGKNLDYGTKIVAGVTPGKGGQKALDDRVPVFSNVGEAVEETGATASLVFVPPRYAADAILEAEAAGCTLIVCITEGIPVREMMLAADHLRGTDAVLVGPNCPGLISPGKANIGIIPVDICAPGPVGLVSRSGTLTYQIVNELTTRGIGQSTCLGIGGDPIIGTNFIDALERFEGDDETKLIVFIGEIGGDAEERAADYIAENVTKPVVAYIAGFSAPPGKKMGHAGAIITGSSGTAEAKAKALEAKGVRVGRTPTEVAELVQQALP